MNQKHKDHFIFINSLMYMRKLFDIFLHLRLFSLHLQLFSSCIAEQAAPDFIYLNTFHNSVDKQQKDFRIQRYPNSYIKKIQPSPLSEFFVTD